MSNFTLHIDNVIIGECNTVLVVPKDALTEPAKIYAPGIVLNSQEKHTLFALTQTLLYQFQDKEIDAQTPSSCLIETRDYSNRVTEGIVLYRLDNGAMGIISFKGNMTAKFLEIANRFCTRWVRVDL